MSISFKFDDLNFTTHMSASDIKGRERVFLVLNGTDDWFAMYQCRGLTPTILFSFSDELDGELAINGHRLFNRFRHTFKDFVSAAHNWFTSEYGFIGLPTCKLHPETDLSVIGLKTLRYVNTDELVFEWVDEVVDPVDTAIDNLSITHDRAFGTAVDVHGCGSCNLCCKTPVGSVCALPVLTNVAVPVYQESNINWLSSVSSPSDTIITYRLIILDGGQKFPSWCKLSHNNYEAKRQRSRITVMKDRYGRPIPLLEVPYDLNKFGLVSIAGLEPLTHMTTLPDGKGSLLCDELRGYVTLSDLLKGAACNSDLAFIKWNSENNLDLPMFR